MAYEIEAPAEFMSGIIAELNSKKADIADVDRRRGGPAPSWRAACPWRQMFGYASDPAVPVPGPGEPSRWTPAGFRKVAEEELEARAAWSGR